jgi:hypothetical protein
MAGHAWPHKRVLGVGYRFVLRASNVMHLGFVLMCPRASSPCNFRIAQMELGVVMGRNKHPLAPCKPRQAHSLHTAMERHKWEESVSWGQLSAREPSGGGGKCLLAVGRRVRQTRDRDTATAPACSSLAHECCVRALQRSCSISNGRV